MIQETVTPASNSEPVDIEACVALYVELRDEVSKLKAELDEKLKPYTRGLERLDTILLGALQAQGAKNIRTAAGTVSQRIVRSATIKDKKAFRDYVIANMDWDLLDWKANKVAVFTHMEKKAIEVPGVNTSAHMGIGVRRATHSNQESDDE